MKFYGICLTPSELSYSKSTCAVPNGKVSKEPIDTMRRQPTEWEKTFANYTSSKGLMSKIHTELVQVKKEKQAT